MKQQANAILEKRGMKQNSHPKKSTIEKQNMHGENEPFCCSTRIHFYHACFGPVFQELYFK